MGKLQLGPEYSGSTIEWLRHVTGIDDTILGKETFPGPDVDVATEELVDGALYILCTTSGTSPAGRRFDFCSPVCGELVTFQTVADWPHPGRSDEEPQAWAYQLKHRVRLLLATSKDIETMQQENERGTPRGPVRIALSDRYPDAAVAGVIEICDFDTSAAGAAHFIGEDIDHTSAEFWEDVPYLARLGGRSGPALRYVLFTIRDAAFHELDTVAASASGRIDPGWHDRIAAGVRRHEEARLERLLNS